MRLVRTHHTSSILFQVVPLLDILFLILVFFILSATFVSQPGIAVDPPGSHFAVEPALRSQIVSILGTSQIFFRDQLVTQEELEKLLSSKTAKSTSPATIILKADRTVAYDQVMTVTNLILTKGYRVILASGNNEKIHSPQ